MWMQKESTFALLGLGRKNPIPVRCENRARQILFNWDRGEFIVREYFRISGTKKVKSDSDLPRCHHSYPEHFNALTFQ